MSFSLEAESDKASTSSASETPAPEGVGLSCARRGTARCGRDRRWVVCGRLRAALVQAPRRVGLRRRRINTLRFERIKELSKTEFVDPVFHVTMRDERMSHGGVDAKLLEPTSTGTARRFWRSRRRCACWFPPTRPLFFEKPSHVGVMASFIRIRCSRLAHGTSTSNYVFAHVRHLGSGTKEEYMAARQRQFGALSRLLAKITCGLLECPMCEARFFYDSTGPPRINMLSPPAVACQVVHA